jgi:hypothetical protein
VGGFGCPEPVAGRGLDAGAVAGAAAAEDHVPGVFGVAEDDVDELGGPAGQARGRVGVQPGVYGRAPRLCATMALRHECGRIIAGVEFGSAECETLPGRRRVGVG